MFFLGLVVVVTWFSGVVCAMSKASKKEEPVNHTYGIPLSFHNPYMDKIFKSVDLELDPPFEFPTKPNVLLFHNFSDFLNKTNNMQIHPYAFQFPRSLVNEVLSGTFDLALATMQNPKNMTAASEFSDYVLSDPLQKLRLDDCMSKCPNPDVYEPYPSPFLDIVKNALRRADRDAPRKSALYKLLNGVPRNEGLDKHDVELILDEEKFEEHIDVEAHMVYNLYDRDKINEKFQAWNKANEVKERATRVGNMTQKKESEKIIAELEKQLESKLKAGFMWHWSRTMFMSAWDLNTFSRFMKWTPNILDPLEWFLDKFASPFYNSGRFYYPPGATREWHTNVYSGGVGWRAYVVRKFPKGANSGTVILHPNTGETAVMKDLDEMSLNIFRIGDIRAPNWHCVYSENAHRFSLGMKLKNQDVYRILQATGNAAVDPSLDDEAKIWREKYAKQLEKILEMERMEKLQYQQRLRAMEFQKNQTRLAELVAGVVFKGVDVEAIVDALSERIQSRIFAVKGKNETQSLESLLMERIYHNVNKTLVDEKKNETKPII